jgi:hypothetical protein
MFGQQDERFAIVTGSGQGLADGSTIPENQKALELLN